MQDYYLHLSNESLMATLDPSQLVKIEEEVMRIAGLGDDCWKGDVVWGFHVGTSPSEKRAIRPVLVLYPLSQAVHDDISKAVNGSPVFYINVDRRFMSTIVVIAQKTDRNSIAFCENYKVLQNLSVPYLDSEHNQLTGRVVLNRRESGDDYLPPELYRMGEGPEIGEVVEIPDIHEVHGLREKNECSTLAVRVNTATRDQVSYTGMASISAWAGVILPMIQGMSNTQRQALAKALWDMEEDLNLRMSRRALRVELAGDATPEQLVAVISTIRDFCRTHEVLGPIGAAMELSSLGIQRPALMGRNLTPEQLLVFVDVEKNLQVARGGQTCILEESATSFYGALHNVIIGKWGVRDLAIEVFHGDRRTPTPLVVHVDNVRDRNDIIWQCADGTITYPGTKVVVETPRHDNCAAMRSQQQRSLKEVIPEALEDGLSVLGSAFSAFGNEDKPLETVLAERGIVRFDSPEAAIQATADAARDRALGQPNHLNDVARSMGDEGVGNGTLKED